jgi:hypothetical protein
MCSGVEQRSADDGLTPEDFLRSFCSQPAQIASQMVALASISNSPRTIERSN